MNGRTNNRLGGLALSFLGSLCLAAAAVPALAAPNKPVSVTVNPTTGYFEATPSTYRVPPGVKVSPVKDVSAVVVQRLPGGGLAQPISSGIEITALKQSAPVQGRFRAGATAVRGAATRCFTGIKCNLAFMAGSVGLEALFDGLDWVMGEGGQIQRKVLSDEVPAISGGYTVASQTFATANQACSHSGRNIGFGEGKCFATSIASANGAYLCQRYPDACVGSNCACGNYYTSNPVCPAGSIASPFCVFSSHAPVQGEDIISGFQNYNPHPSDFRFISPGFELNAGDIDFELLGPVSIQEPTKTKRINDAFGNPISVQETNTWHDFTPVDNPSKQPGLKDKKTEESKTYDSTGTLTGSSTTTTNINASNTTTAEAPENPVDCDLMPSLCVWMDWTQEDPELDEPDLDSVRQVIDLRDHTQTVTVGPESMACPAPFEVPISFINRSVSISFEPFCNLADFVRPLLLMFAFFSAAYITVRSI